METQLPPSRRGAAPNFWPMSIVAKQSPRSTTAEHLLLYMYVCKCMFVTCIWMCLYRAFQKKTVTLFFGHNFDKWTPIFTILSLLDSAGTFLQTCYRDFHLTLDVLLHYLAKSENQYIRVLKTIPSFSHDFFLKRLSFINRFLCLKFYFNLSKEICL